MGQGLNSAKPFLKIRLKKERFSALGDSGVFSCCYCWGFVQLFVVFSKAVLRRKYLTFGKVISEL